MGIVRRQSIKTTVAIYAGMAIGAFNILYLFPRFLTVDEFGMTRVLFSIGAVFVSLATFGLPAVMVKFAPYYQYHIRDKKNDFLAVALVLTCIGTLLFMALTYLFKDVVCMKYSDVPLLVNHYNLVYPFSSLLALATIVEVYSYTNYKTVIPTVLREFGLRAYVTVLILLKAIDLIDWEVFILLFSLCNLFFLFAMLIYILRSQHIVFHFQISHVTRRLRKIVLLFATYTYSANVIRVLSEQASLLLIFGVSGQFKDPAVFAFASYMAVIITVPNKALSRIAGQVLAKYWKNYDMPAIDKIYRKTAINQMVAGLVMFLVIWVNIENVFRLVPNSDVYIAGMNVILIMSMSKILDLGAGVNSEVISVSNYWRFNFLSQTLLLLLLLPATYYLIGLYGMDGAAWADLGVYFIYNSVRFGFIWWKFKLQPFGWKNALCLALAIASYYGTLYIPHLSFFGNKVDVYADIVLRGGFIATLFLGSCLLFRVSEDINGLVELSIIKLKERLKKD